MSKPLCPLDRTAAERQVECRPSERPVGGVVDKCSRSTRPGRRPTINLETHADRATRAVAETIRDHWRHIGNRRRWRRGLPRPPASGRAAGSPAVEALRRRGRGRAPPKSRADAGCRWCGAVGPDGVRRGGRAAAGGGAVFDVLPHAAVPNAPASATAATRPVTTFLISCSSLRRVRGGRRPPASCSCDRFRSSDRRRRRWRT